MNDSNIRTLAFMGPRPQNLGGFSENNPLATGVREMLQTMVPELCEDGYTRFISGMALGVDSWAAETVLRKRESTPGIRLVAAVPFSRQCNPWPAKARSRWLSMLKAADEIYLGSENRYVAYAEFYEMFRTIPLEPLPGHIASRLLHQRNQWMVDECDRLLVIWDGKEAGTGKTVEYALAQEKWVIQHHPYASQSSESSGTSLPRFGEKR